MFVYCLNKDRISLAVLELIGWLQTHGVPPALILLYWIKGVPSLLAKIYLLIGMRNLTLLTKFTHVSSTGHVLSSQSRKEVVEKGLGSLSFNDYGIKCPLTLVQVHLRHGSVARVLIGLDNKKLESDIWE